MAKRKPSAAQRSDSPFSIDYSGVYYDPKSPANLLDLKNRQQFLYSAAQHVPKFANSLLDATVPLVADQISRWRATPSTWSPEHNDTASRAMAVAAIRNWARSFDIEANWIVAEAWGIVSVAADYSHKGIDPLKAFGTWRRSPHPGSETHPFPLPAWNPMRESPGAYTTRANKAWTQSRKEYMAAKRMGLSEAGLEKVPEPRERRFSEELRFKWAVLHRCTSKSIQDLADIYGEDVEVIRISVSRILKDIDLERQT